MNPQRIVIAAAAVAALALLLLVPRAFERTADRPMEAIELRPEPSATPTPKPPKARERRKPRRRERADRPAAAAASVAAPARRRQPAPAPAAGTERARDRAPPGPRRRPGPGAPPSRRPPPRRPSRRRLRPWPRPRATMMTTETRTETTTERTTTEATMTEPRRLLASARARILLAIVVLLAFSTLLSVLAIRELLLARTSDRIDEEITQEIGEFRALAGGRNPRTGELFRGDLPAIYETYFRRNVPAQGETVIGYADGHRPISTSGARGGRIAVGEQAARWQRLARSERGEFESPSGVVRYLAVPVRGSNGKIGGTFVVTAALGQERDEVEDAVRLAAIVLLTVLLIASALAWVVAGRVLAPLRMLSDTARSIGESDLTRRIPASGTDELAELGRTFNAMLDRLEAAFDSQRSFVSDASHELRTPITIVRGHLELLGDDPEERQETIALVTDELDRMSRFVDDLLLLARAEQRRLPARRRGRARRADRRARRQGLGARRPPLERRAPRRGRARRRPPAADPGDDGARAERGPAHRRRRRDRARQRPQRQRGAAVGPRQRAGHRAARPGAGVRALRPGERAGAALGGRRARARDRAGDRRGPRRARRAREPHRARRDVHARAAARRRRSASDEPHPDRRGRAAALELPREGPARGGLHDDGLRGRRAGRGDGASTTTSSC